MKTTHERRPTDVIDFDPQTWMTRRAIEASTEETGGRVRVVVGLATDDPDGPIADALASGLRERVDAARVASRGLATVGPRVGRPRRLAGSASTATVKHLRNREYSEIRGRS